MDRSDRRFLAWWLTAAFFLFVISLYGCMIEESLWRIAVATERCEHD